MRSRLINGILAGLGAGVVFGLMMQMISAPTPEGAEMPMMATVAKVVGSGSLFVGWLYHLFNSALIGAIIVWLFGRAVHTYRSGLGWGALYGFAWWIIGGLILMPVFL